MRISDWSSDVCSSDLRALHLSLAFGEARLALLVALFMAGRTGHAFHIKRGQAVRRAHRHAASVAQRVAAGGKAVAQCHPLIEDEAFAFPEAFLRGYRLQIFEDAAFQVDRKSTRLNS